MPLTLRSNTSMFKFMKFFLLITGVFILAGCSAPATPEDIKAAIKECPGAESFIGYAISDCQGVACREPSPLTKREINGLVDDCKDRLKEEVDPSSPENILKAQRAALAAE